METASLHFSLRTRVEPDEALEELQRYLGALWCNGQILGTWTTIARARDGYSVFVTLPEADSLDPRHSSRRVRRAVRALVGIGFGAPRCRRLGNDPEGRPACACRRRGILILFTSHFHGEPPVRCGTCFDPVPLYRLPADAESGDHQYLLNWQTTYQAMDWLWIGSGAGERAGHDQMARHDSPLSKDGRALARDLERRAHRPVYYYLAKSLARSHRQEVARKCPSCGRGWLLDTPLHGFIDFKCDRCRLMSNISWNVRR